MAPKRSKKGMSNVTLSSHYGKIMEKKGRGDVPYSNEYNGREDIRDKRTAVAYTARRNIKIVANGGIGKTSTLTRSNISTITRSSSTSNDSSSSSSDSSSSDSEAGDDYIPSGKCTAARTLSKPGRVGQRSAAMRKSDSQLNAFSSNKEIAARLAAMADSAGDVDVFTLPVRYVNAKSMKLFAPIEDTSYGATEAVAIEFLKKSTANTSMVLMTPETSRRAGRPAARDPCRHAWVVVVDRSEGEKKLRLAIWDGDGVAMVRDKRGRSGRDVVALSALEGPVKRMVLGVMGKKGQNAQSIHFGGWGNEGKENCLELARGAMLRVIDGKKGGLAGVGLDLTEEKMVGLTWGKW